ncbi:MAG: LysR substrate-binding domain-containing protein [Fusobacterium perfoetens]|uniref:LysR family transcriptional regulator n=1 Tax=Fusobacterium perfoetens TaxID=852 RepID=UPI0023EFBE92|nr:LysR substrate-binding domain-containing protein [Fusobacterium perfoetens]MCI6151635.1 LysR substrate-binding domain-containing protein [Fusobacterium perfoetens]MDY3237803.1 LysR substrate-binding domain-containing protein [Fusobacterium perfoetens]
MLNEMQYIYTIYKERSFSKAAKKLYISQPALSAMVKKVEQKIGYLLFDRETIPLTVTKEGKYYIKCVENILEIENNMQKYFEDLGKLDSGNIVIGASSFFCAFILPKLIGKFKEKYPKVNIEVIEGNIKELKEGLENNSIDLILETAISENDEKLKTYFYKNEHILLAVPSKWEINDKLKEFQLTYDDIKERKHLNSDIKEVSLNEFKNFPFITMKKGNDQYVRGLALCKKAGFTPKSIYKIDQIMTGYHIALFTESAVIFIRDLLIINEQKNESLVYYKLDSELSTRAIYFATKKNKYLSNACKEFLKFSLEK